MLGSLAPRLAPKEMAEALAAAKAIRDQTVRVRALGLLGSHLPPEHQSEVLAEALAAAKGIRDERSRAQALKSLAPYISPTQYVVFITSLVEAAARLSRSGALESISASVHISAALGGVESLEIIRRTIKDVTRWYS